MSVVKQYLLVQLGPAHCHLSLLQLSQWPNSTHLFKFKLDSIITLLAVSCEFQHLTLVLFVALSRFFLVLGMVLVDNMDYQALWIHYLKGCPDSAYTVKAFELKTAMTYHRHRVGFNKVNIPLITDHSYVPRVILERHNVYRFSNKQIWIWLAYAASVVSVPKSQNVVWMQWN